MANLIHGAADTVKTEAGCWVPSSQGLKLVSGYSRFFNSSFYSRDITIESKRIIFCLHRIKHDDYSNKDDVMTEANKRLEDLKKNEWSKVNFGNYDVHINSYFI